MCCQWAWHGNLNSSVGSLQCLPFVCHGGAVLRVLSNCRLVRFKLVCLPMAACQGPVKFRSSLRTQSHGLPVPKGLSLRQLQRLCASATQTAVTSQRL